MKQKKAIAHQQPLTTVKSLPSPIHSSLTVMTQLLEKAIAQIKQLPETEQDRIALLILEEIEDESRWDQAFAKSHDMLAQLAAAALAENQAGKTLELDPENL